MRPDTVKPLKQKGLKHADCPFYVECLTLAVNQGWDYWSCGKCENHMLSPVIERLQFIEEYYPVLAQIYPEFRRKYGQFMESRHESATCGEAHLVFARSLFVYPGRNNDE